MAFNVNEGLELEPRPRMHRKKFLLMHKIVMFSTARKWLSEKQNVKAKTSGHPKSTPD